MRPPQSENMTKKEKKSSNSPKSKYFNIEQIISQAETDNDHEKVKMWKLILKAAIAKDEKAKGR